MDRLNCVYCGGNGVYVPIGQAGRTCGFCGGSGIGHPSQFAECSVKEVGQSRSKSILDRLMLMVLAIGMGLLAVGFIMEITR